MATASAEVAAEGGERPLDDDPDVIVARRTARSRATFHIVATSGRSRCAPAVPKKTTYTTRTFFEAENHVGIEELLSQVRAQDASVGSATVYRPLKLLTECGAAFEHRFDDGLAR